MDGYFKVMRSEATRELLRDTNAWALLTLIAFRAKRTSGLSVYDLEPGEALIGDYEACGLTEQKYRTAKKKLAKYGLATFRATNRGTIAKLIGTDVFDVNVVEDNGQVNGLTTTGQRTGNRQATTNKNEKKGKNEINRKRRRLEIHDYSDIHDPEHDAIAVALAVTGENGNGQAEGFYRKELKAIGDKRFRQAVSDLWGELKVDNIRKPGAILTLKLKAACIGPGRAPDSQGGAVGRHG